VSQKCEKAGLAAFQCARACRLSESTSLRAGWPAPGSRPQAQRPATATTTDRWRLPSRAGWGRWASTRAAVRWNFKRPRRGSAAAAWAPAGGLVLAARWGCRWGEAVIKQRVCCATWRGRLLSRARCEATTELMLKCSRVLGCCAHRGSTQPARGPRRHAMRRTAQTTSWPCTREPPCGTSCRARTAFLAEEGGSAARLMSAPAIWHAHSNQLLCYARLCAQTWFGADVAA
jgi:hypothetical protein